MFSKSFFFLFKSYVQPSFIPEYLVLCFVLFFHNKKINRQHFPNNEKARLKHCDKNNNDKDNNQNISERGKYFKNISTNSKSSFFERIQDDPFNKVKESNKILCF